MSGKKGRETEPRRRDARARPESNPAAAGQSKSPRCVLYSRRGRLRLKYSGEIERIDSDCHTKPLYRERRDSKSFERKRRKMEED